jgi:hypothetical protein
MYIINSSQINQPVGNNEWIYQPTTTKKKFLECGMLI